MIRKVFWCGTFLMVAAATGVYWAADFCWRHPDSTWVHYAVQVAQWGQGIEPLWRTQPTTALDEPRLYPEVATLGTNSADTCGMACQPRTGTSMAAERDPNLALPAPIDLAALALPGSSSARTEEPLSPELIASPAIPYTVSDLVLPTSIGPFATDRDEDAYRIMPPCLDAHEELPATMPYAVDADWSGQLFPSGRGCCPTARPSCPAGCQTGTCSPVKPILTQPAGARDDAEEQASKAERYPRRQAPGTAPISYPVVPLQPPVPHMIDTTEFRPSDARKGEFDRSPL